MSNTFYQLLLSGGQIHYNEMAIKLLSKVTLAGKKVFLAILSKDFFSVSKTSDILRCVLINLLCVF